MAHKKGTGSTRNGRDSNAKRLGVKAYGGESVTAGSCSLPMLTADHRIFFTGNLQRVNSKDDKNI